MELASERSTEIESHLKASGMDFEGFDPRLPGYVLTLMPGDEKDHESLILDLLRRASEHSSISESVSTEDQR